MTRVLLVEDSVDLLYVLQIELESLGYEVEAAANGDAALVAAQRRAPDVIVSDLGMPAWMVSTSSSVFEKRQVSALCRL